MSLIGKKPITIAEGVSVVLSGREVQIKGPKGELTLPLRPEIKVEQKGNTLEVSVKDTQKPNAKAFHGLMRSLLANAVEGVSRGFVKELEMEGMGYRVQKKGHDLEFALGFSHPVIFKAREGVELTAPEQTKITVSGINKGLIGQTAADIRALRKPEPYKGKGIRYVGEVIRRKAGKAGKVGGGAPGAA
ncbi:MAG: 50S ribosomal protein L6 [bacterium]